MDTRRDRDRLMRQSFDIWVYAVRAFGGHCTSNKESEPDQLTIPTYGL